MLFLLHQWDALMNYEMSKSFGEAKSKEAQFDNFFKNVKAVLRQCDIKSTNQKWNKVDRELDELLHEKEFSVREALCDNFNTKKVIQQDLSELVTQLNKYLD